MACPPPECEDGDTRPGADRCEVCTCEEGAWACEPTECPPPECEAGDTWDGDDECTACTCEDGEWACLPTPCPPPECEAGDSRDAGDGCNTCTCDAEGNWACTEMACGDGCVTDDDCVVTGCSGQICANTDVATTCEFLPVYACYRAPTTSCGCFAGECGWERTAALAECIEAGGPDES